MRRRGRALAIGSSTLYTLLERRSGHGAGGRERRAGDAGRRPDRSASVLVIERHGDFSRDGARRRGRLQSGDRPRRQRRGRGSFVYITARHATAAAAGQVAAHDRLSFRVDHRQPWWPVNCRCRSTGKYAEEWAKRCPTAPSGPGRRRDAAGRNVHPALKTAPAALLSRADGERMHVGLAIPFDVAGVRRQPYAALPSGFPPSASRSTLTLLGGARKTNQDSVP